MTKNLYMEQIGKKAKKASINLNNIDHNKKKNVLKLFSRYLKTYSQSILKENKKDISIAKSKKMKNSFIERLHIDNEKIEKIRNSINDIIKFR